MSESDLLKAVKSGNVEEAKRLVASGVSIQCKDEVIETVILIC